MGPDRDEAIKALTINAAEILGVADRIGSIEAGKDANLFIVERRSARGADRGHARRSSRATTSASTNKHLALYERYIDAAVAFG